MTPTPDTENSEFIQILVKLQTLVPSVLELKKSYDKVYLVLEGSRFDGKPSLIEAVQTLQEDILLKTDKDKVEAVFVIQEKEIKRLMEVTENLPEKVEALEKFVNYLKSIPGLFLWMIFPVTLAVIGNFIVQMILRYLPLPK